MSFDLLKWYKKSTEGKILYSFLGSVTEDIITSILDKVEVVLKAENTDTKTFKKTYHISVEALQNLYHHSDSPNKKGNTIENNVVFIIKKNEDPEKTNYQLNIITGNFINKSNTRLLKERIDQLNFLNKEEIKTLYKLILNNDEFSEKGGGGLGMIDLVKRSGNNLTYNFYNFNSNYIFFTLRIAI
ncbi:MAG: hypothetical protein GXO80_11555 [Chlorobi bacterium]|nr:hypothetical protein [Chlorobiota bacterium]